MFLILESQNQVSSKSLVQLHQTKGFLAKAPPLVARNLLRR